MGFANKRRTQLMLTLWAALALAACAAPTSPSPDNGPSPDTPATSLSTAPSAQSPTESVDLAASSTAEADPARPVAQLPDIVEYPVPSGSHPHDVAPAPDGTVWYTAQRAGELGRLDPSTGSTIHIPLGPGSAPHGVIVGPDGAPWITDSGLNAIVRVDPVTEAVTTFPLPQGSGYANLNTAVFDASGVLWFTGQSGVYGRLDPEEGRFGEF